jgi:hypothetical protein
MVVASCGSEPATAPKDEAPETLAPGLYELTSAVTAVSSTDNSTPATALKQGDKSTIRACVTEDGPAPELFAETPADKCEVKNSYVRYGRISAQMSCKREGLSGDVMPAMTGSFKADSFDGEITTLTYLTKDGDYRMNRKISAKRVGNCPA